MLRHKDVPQDSNNNVVSQRTTSYNHRWLHLLSTVTCLALFTLACAFAGSGSRTESDRIVIRRHLPTLTRTPLPTLTPAADAPALEVARVTQAVSATPYQTVSPFEMPTSVKFYFIPTFTPVSAAASEPVEIANSNVPATPVEIAAANPNLPTATTEILPTNTSVPTATEAPTPTSTPTEIPTPTPLPAGWVFSGVQLSPNQGQDKLLVHGYLTNNTDTPQELALISGTFYDAQGQVLADGNTTDWAIGAVSAGGRIPFKLIVPGLSSADNVDLQVKANPSNGAPREEFEFLDVNQLTEDGNYCVAGRLRNPGDSLQWYLVIVAVLSDSQDNVLDFGKYFEYYPTDLVGDQVRDFKVCVSPPDQEVADYELRAWGL